MLSKRCCSSPCVANSTSCRVPRAARLGDGPPKWAGMEYSPARTEGCRPTRTLLWGPPFCLRIIPRPPPPPSWSTCRTTPRWSTRPALRRPSCCRRPPRWWRRGRRARPSRRARQTCPPARRCASWTLRSSRRPRLPRGGAAAGAADQPRCSGCTRPPWAPAGASLPLAHPTPAQTPTNPVTCETQTQPKPHPVGATTTMTTTLTTRPAPARHLLTDPPANTTPPNSPPHHPTQLATHNSTDERGAAAQRWLGARATLAGRRLPPHYRRHATAGARRGVAGGLLHEQR